MFHEAYAAVATGTEVRYGITSKGFTQFRTTSLWYGTPNKTVQKLPYHDTVVCKHQQPNQKVPYHTRAAMVIRSCK